MPHITDDFPATPGLLDLFELDELQRIQDVFAKATGVASIITLPDGTPVTRPSRFCRLCREIIRATPDGRKNCHASDAVIGRPNADGPIVMPCLSGGLWDAGASITVDGRHIGNWLVGQVRNEHQDETAMLKYAESIGADRDEFLLALAEVPVMSAEQLRSVAEALFLLVNELSEKAYLNYRQAEVIRQREAAEAALRENRHVLETILNTMPQSIFWKDAESVYLGCNRAFAKVAGIDHPSQIVGKTDFDMPWLPEESESYRLDDKLVMASSRGKRQYVESQMQSDGRQRWLETSKLPMVDETGRVFGVMGIFEDITERRRAEEAAERERVFSNAVLDSVPGLLYLYNDQGLLVRWNKKHTEITGYTDQELSRMHLLDWYDNDPQTQERITRAMERVRREGFAFEEAELRTKSGERILFYLTAVPLEIDGRTYFTGVGIDIRDRKRTEDTLNFLVHCGSDPSGDGFFRSLARYLAENLSMDFVCIDRLEGDGLTAQTVAVYFDGGFEDDVRYALADTPCGELVERRVCFHPDGVRARFPNDQVLQDMQAESYAGTILWGHNGEPIGLIAVISRNPVADRVQIESLLRLVGVRAAAELERMDAEAQLIKSKDDAEAANRAKSEFLANMSHEIRTPLNGMLGMLQLLISAELGGELGDYASKAFEASSRLLSLLNDILDFSRIEAGAVSLEPRPFRVNDLFHSVTQVFELGCQNKGIAYTLEVDASVPVLLTGDEARIRQILFNLVGNAVKFTSAGGVSLSAWARSSCSPPDTAGGQADNEGGPAERCWLYVTIADTGIGIPDDRLGRIFERFSQVEGTYTRRYEGAGLGLTIIRRIVTMMGGELCVESEVGRGTAMHLALPLARSQGLALETLSCEAGHGADSASDPTPSAGQAPLPPLRILLAEDELISQLALKVMLTRIGHAVTAVTNGRAAVRAMREGDFDCVLMDIQMPEMNGIEATLLIRDEAEFGAKARVPIIALTAYAMASDRDKFLEAGMNDHVSKPVQREELIKALARALSSRGAAAPAR